MLAVPTAAPGLDLGNATFVQVECTGTGTRGTQYFTLPEETVVDAAVGVPRLLVVVIDAMSRCAPFAPPDPAPVLGLCLAFS